MDFPTMTDNQKTTQTAFRLPTLNLRPRSPIIGYGFILPTLLMLLFVLGLPVAIAILNSFTPLWSEEGGFTRKRPDHVA